MEPKLVIISENTLSAMALRGLLQDVVPGLEIMCYNSVALLQADAPFVAHYFISANVLFHNTDFFRPLMRRTIVITEGDVSAITQSGFRTIDATASEQHIVRSLLQIHHMGHPTGPHGGASHPGHMPPSETSMPQLSSRERDVLALIVKGYINKEIAEKLNISLATVIFHRNNISDKLQTRSIGRLTIYAVLNGIVAISEI